jgi:hypothetical protein
MDERIFKIVERNPSVKFNKFSISVAEVNQGIFFMYAGWSLSFIQLNILVKVLESFPNIPLWIFDIDMKEFMNFKQKNLVYSDAWGETFWIKSGEIIGELKKYTPEDIDLLIKNNNLLIGSQ